MKDYSECTTDWVRLIGRLVDRLDKTGWSILEISGDAACRRPPSINEPDVDWVTFGAVYG